MKSLLTLTAYFRRYRGTLILGLTFVVLGNVAEVTIPIWVKGAIDEVTDSVQRGAPGAAAALVRYGLLVLGAAVVGAFFRYFIRQTLIAMSRRIEFDLRQDLWEHVQRLPERYFVEHRTGDVMAHLTNDVNAVRTLLGPVIMYGVDNGVRFLLVLSVMLYYSWSLTLWTLLPLPLLSLLIWRLGKHIHERFREIQESFQDLTGMAQQTFSGIRVVKSYVREERQAAAWEHASEDYRQKQMALARIRALFHPIFQLVPAFAILIILWVGGSMVIRDVLTTGILIAFTIYVDRLVWPMIAFGWIVNMAQQGAASMTRLNALMDEPERIGDGPDTDPTVTSLAGAIEFRDVTFTYPGSETPSLDHVSLSVPAGATYAVVGRTGCGKSTLVSMVPRLHEPDTGQVLVDGHDVRRIPLAVLRRHVAVAPQEAFLFSDSIADNIAFGRDDGFDDRARQAAETAQIAGDVLGFPKGFDTVLGERGVTLSGGQKQRACVARALAADPAILVLDDSFSAVDTHTEERILEGLRRELRDLTALIITQRLSSIRDVDRILVLDDGRLVESGTHAELMAQGGIYADMYRRQQLEHELEAMD